MNIFILSDDPREAARAQCDAHVVKMILESTQLLCNCFPEGSFEEQYKRTHYNHPCAVWARASTGNYCWLKHHAFSLCAEYTRRYGKRHKSEDILCVLPTFISAEWELTPFALAMPAEFHRRDEWGKLDAVESYRAYYRWKKQSMHRFTYTNAAEPEWLAQADSI